MSRDAAVLRPAPAHRRVTSRRTASGAGQTPNFSRTSSGTGCDFKLPPASRTTQTRFSAHSAQSSLALEAELVPDIEAGTAECNCRQHRDVVAEARRLQKARLGVRASGQPAKGKVLNISNLVTASARSNNAAVEASKISK